MLLTQLAWFILFVTLLLLCIALFALGGVAIVSIASASSSPPVRFIDYLRYAGGMVALVAAVAALIGVRHLTNRILVMAVAKWRCFNNLGPWREAEAHVRFAQLLDSHDRFALYLRSFNTEKQEYDEEMVPYSGPQYPYALPGREELRLRISDERSSDTAVVKALSNYLPVVALANPNDPTPPAGLITIYGAEPDWFEIFTALAERASVIAVVHSENTPGLSREMRYLDEHGLRGRTAVLRPHHDPDRIINDLIWVPQTMRSPAGEDKMHAVHSVAINPESTTSPVSALICTAFAPGMIHNGIGLPATLYIRRLGPVAILFPCDAEI